MVSAEAHRGFNGRWSVYFGTIEGIDRPAIATLFPTAQDPVHRYRANSEVKPKNLVQFAMMGKVFIQMKF